MEKHEIVLNNLVNKLSLENNVHRARFRLVSDATSLDDNFESEYRIYIEPFMWLNASDLDIESISNVISKYVGFAIKHIDIENDEPRLCIKLKIVWNDFIRTISEIDKKIANAISNMLTEHEVYSVGRIHTIDVDNILSTNDNDIDNALSRFIYERDYSHVMNLKFIYFVDFSIDIEYVLRSTMRLATRSTICTDYVDIIGNSRNALLKAFLGVDELTHRMINDMFRIKHIGLANNGRQIEISADILDIR